MENTLGKQLNFDFNKKSQDIMPEDITVDELLYVLKHHNDSDLARSYYFEQITEERKRK